MLLNKKSEILHAYSVLEHAKLEARPNIGKFKTNLSNSDNLDLFLLVFTWKCPKIFINYYDFNS